MTQLLHLLLAIIMAGAPGASALVHRDGHTWVAAAGEVRPDDRFRIGSTTKPFVATVVLQLAAERRLRLDDTVEHWLPGALPYGGDVTVRQLLNHTGGVPDDIAPVMGELLHGDRLRVWTPQELIAYAAAQPRTTPGVWEYSNTDYALLGLIVERVTGTRLERELARRIVRPLGLRDTSFPVRSPAIGGRHARGYSLGEDGRLHDFTRYSPSGAWAAGNGDSTLRDLARFQRALLRGRLLGRPELRAMLTGVDTGSPGLRYGLGVFLTDSPCGTLVAFDGDILGFSNNVKGTLDGRRTAAVMVDVKFAPEAVDDAFDRAQDLAMREACG
jgi:D-alanyl-D-alanine carboxypeptidase